MNNLISKPRRTLFRIEASNCKWLTELSDSLAVVLSNRNLMILHNAGHYRLAAQRMKNKRPFMTRVGYVGLGLRYMCPSDLVVVLCGGELPYVLRALEGGLFRLIGECYCDGIMDGKIVSKRTKEGLFLV